MTDSPEKRESKPFEPPPWEREQFEELRRQKQAQPEERSVEPGVQIEREPAPESEATPAEAAPAPRAAVPRKAPPDPQIDTMLIQLGAQEPKIHREGWWVSAVAAVVLGILGTAMLMYALVGALKTSGTGIAGPFGAGVVAIFGLLMMAGAIWSGMRSSRQKRGES